jgi:hypothetical protein
MDPVGALTVTGIESTMRRRSKTGYGTDAAKNIQILQNELADLQNDSCGGDSLRLVSQYKATLGLSRLWRWVDRVEMYEFEKLEIASKGAAVSLTGKLLLIYICNFHVSNHLLLIYICKLHWIP